MQQHRTFLTNGLDLGNVDQALWNTAQGRFLYFTLMAPVQSRLALHVEPILLLFVPFYWMGIGGQVFDAVGVPVDGLIVELGGTIACTEISILAITGNAPVFGPGGYIIELGNTPVASEGTLWLQLLSEGEPQSEKIVLATSAECEQNLLLVNFTERHTVSDIQVRLPIIIK